MLATASSSGVKESLFWRKGHLAVDISPFMRIWFEGVAQTGCVFCVAVLSIFYPDENSYWLAVSQNKDTWRLKETSAIPGTPPKGIIWEMETKTHILPGKDKNIF